MSRIALVAGIVAIACLLAGCGRRGEVRCDDSARYAISDSIPPVRVPQDLSLPGETESLVIPPGARSTESIPEGACLESPPDFFEDDEDEAG